MLEASAAHSTVHEASAAAGASVGQLIGRAKDGSPTCPRHACGVGDDSGVAPPSRHRRQTPPCSPTLTGSPKMTHALSPQTELSTKLESSVALELRA